MTEHAGTPIRRSSRGQKVPLIVPPEALLDAEAYARKLSEIQSLNGRLQHALEETRAMSEALMLSGLRQHELTEKAERLSDRLQRSMLESHHRIKNNLQVISALVELQIDEGDPSTCDAQLRRIHQHVRVLATIHDLLTQQAKLHSESDILGTQAILGRLIPLLEATSGGRHIIAEVDDIQLPTRQAESLCLLVSECVSNAVKHSAGPIDIVLRLEGNLARLEVTDSGTGFPPNFNPATDAHTGLLLIEATACHDLRGEVRYENHSRGGACVSITFPMPAASNLTP